MVSKNKTGSVTIFAMIFLVTLISMIFLFIDASKKIAVDSSTDALCSLWGNSILGEYDQNLEKRYNIFGFYGMPTDVTEKLNDYALYSFHEKKYIALGEINCQLYEFSLVNTQIFGEQIHDVGKLIIAEKIVKKPKKIVSAEKGQPAKIENQMILSGLPSAGSKKSISISSIADALKNIDSVGKLIQRGGDTLLEEEYAFTYFKDRAYDRDLGKTFFCGEIEYIICGKNSDERNINSIRNKIIGTREILNLAYLQKDKVMSGAAMAAAQLLTPGPAALVTQKALLAAWALAESVNDYQLLINGHKIPLMKEAETWAIDLDFIVADKSPGYVYTGVDKGENYEDYLRVFFCAMDENVRLLRMMDLIQINMKYLYYKEFQLRDYNGGLKFNMKVNGKLHETVKKY